MQAADRDLGFNMVKVSKLAADPRNPRVSIRGHERERLIASIKKWGFVVPVLVSEGIIVDGHQRLDVAREMKIDKVPVIDIGSMTDAERIALNVATDRIRTDFDPRKVISIIEGFKVKAPDLATLTGFTDEDMAALKETEQRLDSMDTSFLDNFEAAGELAGDQYETSDATTGKSRTADRVRMHFVLTVAQRDDIVAKLQSVKDVEGLPSMADALYHLSK